MFRKTTMRRAIGEGVALFVIGRLLPMVAPSFWGVALPLVLLARLALFIAPPVWSALRVTSTRREKMSRRFWLLGPQLAVVCALGDVVIALCLGDVTSGAFGGAVAGGADLARFGAHGPTALTPGVFLAAEGATFGLLLVYFTIAVVCTRLANGGFLRFTMPAGNGRVTL